MKNMIQIKRYNSKYKKVWDDFCKISNNSIFLFFRDYMDYHKDRFIDHSLLFYEGNRLLALLPANEQIDNVSSCPYKIISSHDGLTFGSFIIGLHSHQADMIDCVEALIDYCKNEGIKKVYFKPVPLPFQKYTSEQDVYAILREGAKLIKSEPSTITRIKDYIPNYGEKRYCKCAIKNKLTFKVSEDDREWEQYYKLLTRMLISKHGVSPVHSLSELQLLHNKFPQYMKLFLVCDSCELLAGTIVYDYNETIHTQYMMASENGRKMCALHYCLQKIIDYYQDKEWIDFGISTENCGNIINNGLLQFKEGFKGNTLLYNKWSLEIK